MSDTLAFLESNKEAAASNSTDIDLDAVADNLDNLTDAELKSIALELELVIEGGPMPQNNEQWKALLSGYIAGENGTANVTDITQNPNPVTEPASAPTAPMVEAQPAGAIDPTITKSSMRWWLNPFTGNKVPHGQADIDGKQNIDGKAVWAPTPPPTERPPVYGDE